MHQPKTRSSTTQFTAVQPPFTVDWLYHLNTHTLLIIPQPSIRHCSHHNTPRQPQTAARFTAFCRDSPTFATSKLFPIVRLSLSSLNQHPVVVSLSGNRKQEFHHRFHSVSQSFQNSLSQTSITNTLNDLKSCRSANPLSNFLTTVADNSTFCLFTVFLPNTFYYLQYFPLIF